MVCPARKDEADWLVELTGKSGRAYRVNPAEIVDLGLGTVPETAEEFHAKWRESDMAKAIDQARLPKAYNIIYGVDGSTAMDIVHFFQT